MASMILGWTLNDVTHALGMGDMNHLHQLRSEAQKAELAKTVDAILSRVELGGTSRCGTWLSRIPTSTCRTQSSSAPP